MLRMAFGAILLLGTAANAQHHDKPMVMADGHGQHGAMHGKPSMTFADGPVASASVGEIQIGGAFARAATGGSSAAYLVLSIARGDDILRSAASPVSARVELHTHTLDESGVARMREVPGIEVTAGSPTVLQPGGLHVMFMGLKAPLEAGDTFPLTLTFDQAGKVTFDVPVRAMARRPMTN